MAKFPLSRLVPRNATNPLALSRAAEKLKAKFPRSTFDPGNAMIVRWKALEIMRRDPKITTTPLTEELLVNPEKTIDYGAAGVLCSLLEKISPENIGEINQALSLFNLAIEPNQNGYTLTTRGRLVLMSGPSGAGKGAIQNGYFVNEFEKFVFFNTRARREGEAPGITYQFIERKEHPEVVKKFASVATHEVHDQDAQLVHARLLDLVAREGRNIFVEVDANLARQILKSVKDKYPGLNVTYLAVLAPNEETRADRLISRTEQDFPEQLMDMEGKLLGRMGTGAQNYSQMALLGAVPIINDVLDSAVEKAKEAVGAQHYLGALSAARHGNYHGIISGRKSIAQYRTIIEASASKPISPEDITLSIAGREAVIDTLREEIAQSGASSIETITAAMMKHVDGKVNRVASAAIQAGTLSPFHFGHMALSLTGVLGGNPRLLDKTAETREGADAVVLLPGGLTPDKPFALASEHRMALVNKAIAGENLSDRILVSNLREEVAKALEGTNLYESNPEHRRRIVDLVAFSFLTRLNPQIDWKYYLIGSDKLYNYGPSAKNERDLVEGIIAGNNMQLLFTARDARENRDLILETMREKEGSGSWWVQLLENRPDFVVRNSLPTPPISSTELRQKATLRDPLWEYFSPSLISHIYEYRETPTGVADTLGYRRVVDVFELETQAKSLQSSAVALVKAGKPTTELDRELGEINEKRALLGEMGILGNGDPLRINQSGKLVI